MCYFTGTSVCEDHLGVTLCVISLLNQFVSGGPPRCNVVCYFTVTSVCEDHLGVTLCVISLLHQFVRTT